MHIITRTRLVEFGRLHEDADSELREWVRVVRAKRYTRSDDVRRDFPSVDFVGLQQAVFNIRHNAHRLVVVFRFEFGRVFVRHVVTHSAYSRLIERGLLEGLRVDDPTLRRRFRATTTTTDMTALLDFSVPHVLRTEPEFEAAAREIDRLLDDEVPEGTQDWERLRFLSVLVEAYEEERLPLTVYLADCTPQSAVEFMLKQHGLVRRDLEPLLGGKSRVSEFFAGVRSLSKSQIVALRQRFGIPADLLLAS